MSKVSNFRLKRSLVDKFLEPRRDRLVITILDTGLPEPLVVG
ncbi:hypothetical protein [Nostoc sp.]